MRELPEQPSARVDPGRRVLGSKRATEFHSWLVAIGIGALLAAIGLYCVWKLQAPAARSLPSAVTYQGATLASEGIDAMAIVNEVGFELQMYLLSPASLGVEGWKVGDEAIYDYRQLGTAGTSPGPDEVRTPTRKVRLAVLGEAGPDDEVIQRGIGTTGSSWLLLGGLSTFRGKPFDRFLLARPDDLRPSRAAPLYSLQTGYFPNLDRATDLSSCAQAALNPVGAEGLSTPAGHFECQRYEALIGNVLLDLWASPSAGPLGIVAIRSETEELVLSALQRGPRAVDLQPAIEPLITGASTFALGCLSCHFDPADPGKVKVPAR